MVDEIAKLLAITGADARIDIQHNIPLCSHELLFKIEASAVVGKWTAMNLYNQWIFLVWIEMWRLNYPPMNLALVVRRFIPEFFYLAQRLVPKQVCVDRCDLPRPGAIGRPNRQIRRIVRAAIRNHKFTVRPCMKLSAGVSADAACNMVGEFFKLACGGGIAEFGVTLIIIKKINTLTVSRPLDVANAPIKLI